jgi:colanic acid/amylovoran biosynthesis glycosyltransferase
MNAVDDFSHGELPASRKVCAYLINQYPKVSHSFVRREILALERQGWTVHRHAQRGWDEVCIDPQDRSEQLRTRYLLQAGIGALLLAGLRELFHSPATALSALLAALQMGWRSDRSLPFHLIYWLEACLLAQRCREQGVRHLHAHFGTNSAEVSGLAAMLAGIPSSFTVHGPEEFDKPEFLSIARKIHMSAFVVAISSFGRSQLYRWIDRAHWGKVKVVHCGLDQVFLQSADLPFCDAPRLVCIGRLCEQKGQLLLIRAAALLRDQGVPFELVLAGDGDMRADIESEIARLGLQAQVSITGWISGERVKQELLASRAMVLPSFAEGLPVVIMEAMALGRPVVSTYVAGIPELVTPGECGWLFPAGDVEALAQAMKDCLLSGPDQLVRMGQKARVRVLARHDVDVEASKLSSHFAESIGLAEAI